MKPAPFEYVAPRSLDEALDLLANHVDRQTDVKLLAGGQSLIPVLNFRLAQPAVLIDLNRIGDLDSVRESDGTLAIGALTRQRRIERDPRIATLAPLLAEAVPWIAHPQIRNRGTVGGSLAHADPAAELPAVATALDATLHLASVRGRRSVPVAEFYTGLFATALEPDEILIEVVLPQRPPRTGYAFQEIARRHGDYAQAGIASWISLDEAGLCRDARLVFFSVGDGPVIASRAAQSLIGHAPNAERFAAASVLVQNEEIEPNGDIHASADFKRHLAGVLTRRALALATQRATLASNGGSR